MKRKFITVVIPSIIIASLLSSCTNTSNSTAAKATKVSSLKDQYIKASLPSKNPEKAKNRKDTFIAAISEPGGVFLPYFYDNGWDGNATDPIFPSLVSTDEKGNPIADLAEKWDISSDNLTYTYHLRKRLKFSDGSPLTSDDVAFTLTLLDDPSYSGSFDISTCYIKGSTDYKNGKATSISGIAVVDPLTIKITTEKINPLNLTRLGGQVLSKAYYGKDYKKGNLDYLKSLYSRPLGAGPYKLDKYIPGQEIRYTANENYYKGKPKIENFIFKVTSKDTNLQLFQTGEIDSDSFSTDKDTVDQLENLGFANIRISTVSDYGFVYMNNKKPYLKDKNVRQALIYGLDRQKIVDVAYKGYGEVANVPTSPLVLSYTTDGINSYKFNPEKAKKLLEDDGWRLNSNGIREKNGQKLKISYLTSKNTDQTIPIAKENYKALGIDFEPEIMDFNTLVEKLNKGDYDLAAVRTSGLVDPNDSVEEFSSKKTSENVSGYFNPKVDELISEGVNTLNVKKRKAIYKKLYKELSDDPPVILIDYRKGLKAWNSRIKGMENDNFAGVSSTNLSKLKIEN
ncbi:peptide/nickel transport system substrate-binding protein [Clostridium acetobutylicum]|uniref:Oligopeptide ABC transporter, periplasmic binding component n=1 Tax=Clostridium acetobutylicum (strain ATCC 824 / DSM 792 / JCM 1419 / IAM 19013 / LMG 5710 / NBRC 13948 / NRRL B-527 / VKM B-1787 / 2291 / W) TaxID=272562 RepID=Q97ED4_CLOAB|nr:ABC transporter substrate-binding protein [Clostridium acetobutylicum]AAK81116.1 Oligopeptide ABC transporter, periplasmic binding component [Clostridium acetobutylicum ATCC 824]ADZ22220.1 Oligopeptide ABC transporter, periplasmic binding component [Clostridium acetobutylicum EA 2018]AEI32700.1 oligopeptide ABC transporter, periplasmic binding component [Clostridium acetobutylicum DSM 1731]PSM04168.1 ABC transporter substrate-binding protein [Clostridium sp. NJ4]AWV82092.1 ABC transporter s